MQYLWALVWFYDKKGFCKYIGNKRKTKENVGLLLNEIRDLVMQDMEKAELPNAFFFHLVFTSKTRIRESQVSETRWKGWSKEDVPLVEENHLRDQGILGWTGHIQAHGPWWDAPMSSGWVPSAGCHCQVTLDHLCLIMVTGRSAWRLEGCLCTIRC